MPNTTKPTAAEQQRERWREFITTDYMAGEYREAALEASRRLGREMARKKEEAVLRAILDA